MTEIIKSYLGKYQPAIDAAMRELDENNILSRIWNMDHTVWKSESTEITNRLGWLRIAENMKTNITEINNFVSALQDDGYTQILLLGMGGSSLAPEVFRNIFDVKDGFLDLAVLDSTDPGSVLERTSWIKKLSFLPSESPESRIFLN